MSDYRLYFLNAANHFCGVADLACEDDHEAISNVTTHCDGRAMELWRRDRLLMTFPATSVAA